MTSSDLDRASTTRALGELEAARARVEREARHIFDETREKLIAELLPVLDGLDRTIHASATTRDIAALVEGVRMVRAQLENVILGYGVERIDALGARFDPAIHHAIGVSRVSDPARHAIVVEQVEPGYRSGDRILRPAKVVVGRATL
jgi:molecular chaperone GrpE